MEWFNARIEVALGQGVDPDDDDAIEDAVSRLEAHHGVLGWISGRSSARISLQAVDLASACVEAIRVGSGALGAPVVAVEVMTEAEFLAREA